MAGAHASAGAVRLAGVAGLIAGAFSMAAGEYVSMRAQSELMLRELDVEREAIHHDPEDERKELAAIYESRGLDTDLAEELSAGDDARPRARPRDPRPRGAGHRSRRRPADPSQAAISSFVTFAIGAFVPLLPWLVTSGNHRHRMVDRPRGARRVRVWARRFGYFTGRRGCGRPPDSC